MMIRLQLLFLFLMAFGACLTCRAEVDIANTKILILPTDPSEPLLSAENTQRILPKRVVAGESGSAVISEMVDNSFSLWWEKSAVKQSAVGQVADKIDKNLKTEMSLGKSADQKIEHKISVKVLAVQALAKIEYRGWVHAGLNYDARAAATKAEVTEAITDHEDLIVSHAMQSGENRSQVSLSWNW